MLKKVLCVLLALAFVASSPAVYAATGNDTINGMGAKAWRGFSSLMTGWVEIPAQIAKGYEYGFMGKSSNGWVGAVGGIFAGTVSAVGRTVSGAGELTGFWAADNQTNDGVGIPLDADYAWEQGTHYDIADPDLNDGLLKPIFGKLGRGVGNMLFGVAEIPGQMMKATEEKTWDGGLLKGIWYFLSREVDGAIDVATFFLPGPRDVKSTTFDDKWPWTAMGDRTNKAEKK